MTRGAAMQVRWTVAVLAMCALGACDRPAHTPAAPPTGWQRFEGTWNATGDRHVIPLGEARTASALRLGGTMLLTGPDRPGVGFHAEVVGLVDSSTGFLGRGVWTDEQGDQVFSELAGEGTSATNRITGSLLGGTGRYRGISGSFEFSWQFVIESDEGIVQGRAVGLTGEYRIDPAAAAGAPR